jgi:putative ABC transport system ATP-binding protein
MPIISALDVKKSFATLASPIDILKGVTLKINQGEKVAIVGTSGSGKTTLLSILAGLDTPTSGTVWFEDENISALSEDERATKRKGQVGFVFQQFELLPSLNALENVMLPLELSQLPHSKQKAIDMLTHVGLNDRLQHYPNQLSGGEQQRVAIARAFSTAPKIIFADEPTGYLDEKTGKLVMDLLFGLNQKNRTTMIFVTHDIALAKHCDVIYELENGIVHKLDPELRYAH